jgi:hypothetical protein
MANKYVKNPIVIEAVQWIGTNKEEIQRFVGGKAIFEPTLGIPELYIETLEGKMYAHEKSYIIKGIQGEFYPCVESVFLKTYSITE